MKNKFIYIILALVFISNTLLAKDFYTKKDIEIKDKKNVVLGKITKGTKVKILKKDKNKSFIEIQGWSYEEEPNTEIFFKNGVTVVLVDIKKDKVSKREIIQTKEDEYEEVWIENKIQAWIPSNVLTKNFEALWEKESTLAAERCSGCHEIPEPDSHFAGEFPSLMDSMAEQAGLDEIDKATLVNYFQKRNIYKK